MRVTVAGAGILGLWQALRLAEAGHTVHLTERAPALGAGAASAFAGAMLAPDCEAEAAPSLVRDLGYRGLARWRAVYPGLVQRGSLVVAAPRDRPELFRFARLTRNHEILDAARLAALEPALAGRFSEALFFPGEAHMATPAAMEFLLEAVRRAGAAVMFGVPWEEAGGEPDAAVVDCRGMAAGPALPRLRGVRGERVLVRAPDVALSRPVRLLHPRHPIYVVPWGDGRHVIGATVIEREDAGPASVRSVLELLGTAYALHPGFGEAEILDLGAGVRPAFPGNMPCVLVRNGGRRIFVNGAYRHGFLLAPVLADAVAAFLATGALDHPLFTAGE